MRGSDVNWPAAAAPDAPASRTGGSRMLLDELVTRRDDDTDVAAAPQLSIEPVAVPVASEAGRRSARHRLTELEEAARRNLRSAEEARAVLAREHQRLQQESTARAEAQREVFALRRELERLQSEEDRRAKQSKGRAERAARREIAEELKQFQQEHDRVVRELDELRGSLHEHDGLVGEYAERLREEQEARAQLRAELDRAESERRLAERSLERASEAARVRAEDELIRLATAETAVADLRSERDRLAAKLEELTAGDGAIGRLQAEIDERDHALKLAQESVDGLRETLDEARRQLARVTEEHERAVVAREDAQARIAELERTHGDAHEALSRSEQERQELAQKLASAEAELVRARADGDRMRAEAASLGDELAAVRASVAQLQAPAPPAHEDARTRASVPGSAADEGDPPPLARRRPRVEEPPEEPALVEAPVEVSDPAEAPPLPVRRKPVAEPPSRWAAAAKRFDEAVPVEPDAPAARAKSAANGEGFRRTAMAELTAIASSLDDVSPRRR